ncbi:MAG: ribonuclease HIII [Erysipelotrichaceae bacterium]|jgi:ribonuclease HIII|nr:ribonuclease HIII [Erysipelotrichaceae bacterium]
MITIKIDKTTLDKIVDEFKDYIIDSDIGYIMYVFKKDNTMLTIYNNKKGDTFKMTIQGQDPMSIAKKYSLEEKIMPRKSKVVKESPFFIDVDQQIGSDEVGTGDFLGPIVVCAAYCDHETMKLIEQYGIVDSKKLNDTTIMRIVPLLIKKVYYSAKILENDRYNGAYQKGFNINKIKAILHNHCLIELHNKVPYVKNVYMDQFTPEEMYYSYLNGIDKVEKDIIFREKGETYFPSVALGSCIARYLFLDNMTFKAKKYGMKIPFGAGNEVNVFAKKFITKFGITEFDKIAKKNFANYKQVTDSKLV